MMRALLIKLSENQFLQATLSRNKWAQRAVRRFIAGNHLEEALAVTRQLSAKNFEVILNHLGENVRNLEEATSAALEYQNILRRLHEEGVPSHISLKPTHLGLDLSFEVCVENLSQILATATRYQTAVCIDMEGSDHTERTIQLYECMRKAGYSNVGLVLQAYLRRTKNDLERLLPQGVHLRLCKGAYLEPKTIAFPRKWQVDANFRLLTEKLFTPEALSQGVYPAIATHDEKLIEFTCQLANQRGVTPQQFEFQMLYGIRRDLQEKLVARGYRVRIYVSYGSHWYPYFMRRLGERPANVFFLVKNLFRH